MNFHVLDIVVIGDASMSDKICVFSFQQPTEEDPDEGVKELVEIVLKLVVSKFISSLHGA